MSTGTGYRYRVSTGSTTVLVVVFCLLISNLQIPNTVPERVLGTGLPVRYSAVRSQESGDRTTGTSTATTGYRVLVPGSTGTLYPLPVASTPEYGTFLLYFYCITLAF
jgi:hypothetical protein